MFWDWIIWIWSNIAFAASIGGLVALWWAWPRLSFAGVPVAALIAASAALGGLGWGELRYADGREDGAVVERVKWEKSFEKLQADKAKEKIEAEKALQIIQSGKLIGRLVRNFNLMKHYGIDPKTEQFPQYALDNKIQENFNFERTRYLSIKIEVLDVIS